MAPSIPIYRAGVGIAGGEGRNGVQEGIGEKECRIWGG
jgi:hypothetical protein